MLKIFPEITVEKKRLKIQDLAETNRGFVLIDDKNNVVWISYKLRKDLLSAGLESFTLLGNDVSHLRDKISCAEVSLSQKLKTIGDEVSKIELCGKHLFLSELNFRQ